MSLPVLRIAVVGHTNTGKTSLLRTLTRDARFGEVSDRPGTTQHVEGTQLLVGDEPVAELYDTPGLEDSMGLMELIEADGQGGRTRRAERIDRFLESAEARGSGGRFMQEAKALRQVRQRDVALYVIDAREPVLGKYRDELELLSYCGRPIVPVLNFVASDASRESAWREALRKLGLHAIAAFDTVAVDEASERHLYEKMGTLLDEFRATIDALVEDRQRRRRELIVAGARIIAELLVDAAAAAVHAPVEPADALRQAAARLQDQLRDRERACQRQLMERFDFAADDCRAVAAPLEAGRWQHDLFNEETLRQAGVRGGGGAGAGAAIGLGLDVALGGLSLCAGTAIGAILGATFGAGSTRLRQLIDRVRGKVEVRCADATLDILARRQVELVQKLLHRGHAAQTPVDLPASASALTGMTGRRLPRPLRQAREHPGWSGIELDRDDPPWRGSDTRRRAAVDALARAVERWIVPTQSA
ncbi:MAG: GTPase/DUF3482 domain-containing protein [Phycisphaeraceae bacterium]